MRFLARWDFWRVRFLARWDFWRVRFLTRWDFWRVRYLARWDFWRVRFLTSRVIPSFRPRFAGKCDRQSRDLTQLTSGYISRLNRLLITPDHHVRTHTWESIAQKYSMENMNIFYPLPGIDLGHLCIQVERVLHWAMPPTHIYIHNSLCL